MQLILIKANKDVNEAYFAEINSHELIKAYGIIVDENNNVTWQSGSYLGNIKNHINWEDLK